MEVILLPRKLNRKQLEQYCFNPCFYGSYSFTLIAVKKVLAE